MSITGALVLFATLFFLVLFQVFVVVYSSYVAFTNYGAGHNSDKAAAIEIIQRSSSIRVPDSPVYDITVLEEGGDLYLLTLRDGEPVLGGADQELEPVEAQMQDGEPVDASGERSAPSASTSTMR